jgi:hypothetical protein
MDISLLKKIVDSAEKATKGLSTEVSKVVVDVILSVWNEVTDDVKLEKQELEDNKKPLQPVETWKPTSRERLYSGSAHEKEMQTRKLVFLKTLLANGGSQKVGDMYRLLDWKLWYKQTTMFHLSKSKLVQTFGKSRWMIVEITSAGRKFADSEVAA